MIGETHETAIIVASESEEQTDEEALLLNATPSQGESSSMGISLFYHSDLALLYSGEQIPDHTNTRTVRE